MDCHGRWKSRRDVGEEWASGGVIADPRSQIVGSATTTIGKFGSYSLPYYLVL